MIRLIQRRLIIPQGDTGTFTIPVQGSMTANDVAILSIYDPLTRTTVLNKDGELNEEVLKQQKLVSTPITRHFHFQPAKLGR